MDEPIAIQKPTMVGLQAVLKYLKPYKKEFLLLGFLGIISAIANGFVPLIVGRFFDALIKTPASSVYLPGLPWALSTWLFFILLWVGLQLIANGIDYVMATRRNYLSEKSYTSFLSQSFGHIISLPVSFFKEHRIGDTQDRISRAANDMEQIISNVLIDLGPQFLTLAIGVFIVGHINPSLAGLLLTGMLLYILTLIRIVPPIARLQKESRKAYGDAYSTAYEAVSHFDLIKQSTAEEYSKGRIQWHYLTDVFHKGIRTMMVWVKINRFQRAIVVVTQLTVFVFSVSLIQKGSLSIGELIAVNSYAGMIFGPFAIVSRNWQVIQNSMVSVERVNEYLTMPTEDSIDKDKKELKIIKGKIVFKDVHFSYKKEGVEVLNAVSFTVNEGETVALVGESGVGKSTTIQLLSGYYFPNKGSIFIDGEDISQIKRSSLRKHIAVVPQEVVLFNDTILNNIRYGNFEKNEEEIYNAARQAHADSFIEKFPEKYNQLVGERGIKLSVGEKQRVAIARAVLRDPKILILDEPTSALDPQTEKQITNSLEKLMQGRTTFIIAHRLSTVRRADKIFVFDKGKIVEEGNHEQLLAQNGLYKKLHDLHVGLH